MINICLILLVSQSQVNLLLGHVSGLVSHLTLVRIDHWQLCKSDDTEIGHSFFCYLGCFFTCYIGPIYTTNLNYIHYFSLAVLHLELLRKFRYLELKGHRHSRIMVYPTIPQTQATRPRALSTTPASNTCTVSTMSRGSSDSTRSEPEPSPEDLYTMHAPPRQHRSGGIRSSTPRTGVD